MKKLFILLFVLLSFSIQAQVTIKPETALYFLEADDERFVLRAKDSINTATITDLRAEVVAKDLIIATYETDHLTRLAEIAVITQERKDMKQDIEYLKWEVKRQRRLKTTFAGAGIGVIGGSLAGPGGAVLGGAVGAGVGYVIGLFKKKI